jgi:hypothetical protein
MTENLGIGAIRFIVTSSGTAVAGASVYISPPGISYQWIYKGFTGTNGDLNVWNLSTGVNRYAVSKAGYVTATGSVTVINGQTIFLNVNMIHSLSEMDASTVGNLSITSNVSGVKLYIDDILQNVTMSTTIEGIPSGEHVIVVTKEGYNDYITCVTISTGMTESIFADMIPL